MTSRLQKKIIIIGATSGIGLALAKYYINKGHLVGATGRRIEKLKLLQAENLGQVFIKPMDVSHTEQAIIDLENLIINMQGADIIIINAGTGIINRRLEWQREKLTNATNVDGFCALAGQSLKYFIQQKQGHLVSISSISALRGNDLAPAYAASKAYVSNYMQGLRKKVRKAKLPINITDIKPGFVDTQMAQGEGLFWVCSADKAARQIAKAISKKKNLAYVSRRWRIVAWALKVCPDWIYHRI